MSPSLVLTTSRVAFIRPKYRGTKGVPLNASSIWVLLLPFQITLFISALVLVSARRQEIIAHVTRHFFPVSLGGVVRRLDESLMHGDELFTRGRFVWRGLHQSLDASELTALLNVPYLALTNSH